MGTMYLNILIILLSILVSFIFYKYLLSLPAAKNEKGIPKIFLFGMCFVGSFVLISVLSIFISGIIIMSAERQYVIVKNFNNIRDVSIIKINRSSREYKDIKYKDINGNEYLVPSDSFEIKKGDAKIEIYEGTFKNKYFKYFVDDIKIQKIILYSPTNIEILEEKD